MYHSQKQVQTSSKHISKPEHVKHVSATIIKQISDMYRTHKKYHLYIKQFSHTYQQAMANIKRALQAQTMSEQYQTSINKL